MSPTADDHRGPPAPRPLPSWAVVAFELGAPAGRPHDAEWDGTGWPAGRDGRPVWLHLSRSDDATHRWVEDESGADELIADALLAETTRPRVTPIEGGLLLNLRGVNLNDGADPEDMISLRAWAMPDRLVTLRGPRLRSVEDVIKTFGGPDAPATVPQLIVAIGWGLTDRAESVIEGINERLDDLEDAVLENNATIRRPEVVRIRQQAIVLHRYLRPQAVALRNLATPKCADAIGMTDNDVRQLQEVSQLVTRYVEDLEAAKARAQDVKDELSSQVDERANRRVYVVTILAAVFLPPTLISGLLGMNVAGLPGTDAGWAFWAVIAVIVLVAGATLLLLRRWKWL